MERAMQLTLTLPDTLVQQLKSIPDSDNFVREVLQNAVKEYARPPSKWSKMAERIEQNAIELGDYTLQFKHDMQTVRENFQLRDET